MNFAFLFAGQGSQSLNMMNGFDDMPIVQETFAQASDVLQQDFWTMITGNDSEIIGQTVHTQPLMLTAGVATYRAYQALGGQAPSALAGHSLGEYTALTVAGVLSFDEALKLVRLRAQLMQNAVPTGTGAMAAILGLEDDAVRAVCTQAKQATGQVAEAVNFNSPGQVVIAGQIDAITQATAFAKEAGAKRALLLPVSVPSHCRLMQAPAQELANALDQIAFQTPSIPVINNVDVANYRDPQQIKDALVRQLYRPVRWTETIEFLVKQGINEFAECTPNKVLAGLVKRIDKSANCTALVNTESLKGFIAQHQ